MSERSAIQVSRSGECVFLHITVAHRALGTITHVFRLKAGEANELGSELRDASIAALEAQSARKE